MSNIVLCGGTTQLPNFVARFKQEVDEACPKSLAAGVYAPGELDLPWLANIGGSVLTHVATGLPNFWITRAEYEEFGPSIVMRRCY